ncbi:MAG: DUF3598 family protein [Pegethrix bostrychoides GSE-TBD4-15B]|jgi:hypothetical protein|uniref:DUF3598 family protein n=1 Tax=Pegethrix bostrychoides GSE-TBD4-15B TaxID=2839662 RepID=A0A951U2R4_9CYAN|nr:DUF3598 family protein [Pegethrix bostrychoides GSE-TBD4-15B]
MTESQWDYLLKNLGRWSGSFTRLSPAGQVQSDQPSLVTLEALNNRQTIRQAIQKFDAAGKQIYDRTLEYSSLGRSTLFFADGAFSQGSTQFGAFAEFGAELGLISGDRRLRLVQQFAPNSPTPDNPIPASQLSQITLIREHRQGTPVAARPALTPEQLVGSWQGEAVTLYPDWRPLAHFTTALTVHLESDRLIQQISTPDMSFSSSAQIDGNILRFEQGRHPMQLLLLPDGASCNTPLRIPCRQAFLLEVGWLLHPNHRQRMIRSYDAQGEWISLTLVNEYRQNG